MAPYSKEAGGYVDDGGAAKSNDRLRRRRMRLLVQKIKYTVIVIACFVLLRFSLDHSEDMKHSIMEQRKRSNKALNKLMTKEKMEKRQKMKKQWELDKSDEVNEKEISADDDEKDNYREFRWSMDSILPPIGNQKEWAKRFISDEFNPRKKGDFKTAYRSNVIPWEKDAEKIEDRTPKLDYTKHEYEYPEIIPEPPRGGAYPAMETLGDLLKQWPQNEIDEPPSPIVERLQHFDFTDPEQLIIAKKYRDLEFPFKLTNVPELLAANEKWTDDYLSFHFDRKRKALRNVDESEFKEYTKLRKSEGHAQESVDSFFAFFIAKHWNVGSMGKPPTKDNDFTFERWARHARYADSVSLDEHKPHYYWQSGASPTERKGPKDQWTMISVDLPSFSDTEANFISFNPAEAKGIQCRFGERGVTAATHYDGGRNMVGMITGAKRYILAPPVECAKLGIVTAKMHPTFRHSLLNFGHINILDSDESNTMPESERDWLNVSKKSMAIETVLKAGEILYIPSHWFHYITSLQKSAQCNVRSGREYNGSPEWGSSEDVLNCEDV